MRHILGICLALILSGFVYAQKVTVQQVFNDTPVNGTGYFYYLPKVIFEVEVTMVKTEKYKGALSRFAEKYFGKENYVKADSREYLLSRVDLKPIVVPDPEHLYFVNTDKAKTFSVSTNSYGILRAINEDAVANELMVDLYKQKKGFILPENRRYSPILQFGYSNDTIVKRENVTDSEVVERRSIRKVSGEKSPEEQAKEAIEKIQEIRKFKYNLITNPEDLAIDGNAMKFMIQELNKLEQDYLQMFLGYSFQYESKVKFLYTPEVGVDRAMFNFTKEKGVYFNKSIVGLESVKFELTINTDHKTLRDHNFKIQTAKESALKYALKYRLPVNVSVKMTLDGEVLYEGNIMMPQFGTLLSIGLKDLEKSQVIFDENTGNILKFHFKK